MVKVVQIALATGALSGGLIIEGAGIKATFLTGASLCLVAALIIFGAYAARGRFAQLGETGANR